MGVTDDRRRWLRPLGSAAVLIGAVAAGAVGAAGRQRLRDLEQRATRDGLTGLTTRDELHSRLEASLSAAYRHDGVVGVLFLDLDGFKTINDPLGHDAGDELLKAFADRLSDTVRSEDIVGRMGGDEFVVVCTGLDRPTAVHDVAIKIRAEFARPFEQDEGSVMMTPSIGIATANRREPASATELIARADQAMYRAKRGRLGIQQYNDDQRDGELDRLAVERALVPALADGQFHVHYQPIVSRREQRTVGLEGLIRWQHPIHGVLGPDRFLTIAEEAGVVARLGEVVLREVAAQTSVWNHFYANEPSFSVSVNLAERQLVDPSFPDRVADIVGWAGIPASQLHLEVREELLLRRADDESRVLQRLSELGCRIVIDDFGNSHGSFTRIRELDIVSLVKIDRSIIARLGHDNVSRTVVGATAAMATSVGMDVIAEGIETIEQRDIAESLGIDLMQGYLFQAPQPATSYDRTGPLAVSRGEIDLSD